MARECFKCPAVQSKALRFVDKYVQSGQYFVSKLPEAGRMTKKLFMAVAVVISLATPANAQNDVCRDQNGNIGQNASEGWQDFQAKANAQAMRKLTGVWYVEIPNQLNPSQVAYRYTAFESNGLFTAQTRVCANGFCSDYPGHGFWASQGRGNNIVTMSIFSDTQVTNYCSITQMQLQGPNSFQDQHGNAFQRQL